MVVEKFSRECVLVVESAPKASVRRRVVKHVKKRSGP
jgi:hypothetical protein